MEGNQIKSFFLVFDFLSLNLDEKAIKPCTEINPRGGGGPMSDLGKLPNLKI